MHVADVLAPEKTDAEGVDETLLPKINQAEPEGGGAYTDFRSGRDFVAAVVQAEGEPAAAGVALHGDAFACRHDERAEPQVVRCYRSEQQNLGIRQTDGTACAEIVGRGARTGGGHETVCPVGWELHSAHGGLYADGR